MMNRSVRMSLLVVGAALVMWPGAAAAQQTADPASPFEASPETPASPFSATQPATPAPQPAPAQQPQPVVVVDPAPALSAGYAEHMRLRGARALGTGIGLLVLSSVPLGLAGAMIDDWEACHWNGEGVEECGRTGAFAGSVVLFTFGGLFAVAGLALIPTGASRLARASRMSRRERWIGSLSPYASPTRDGGAVFGISGLIF